MEKIFLYICFYPPCSGMVMRCFLFVFLARLLLACFINSSATHLGIFLKIKVIFKKSFYQLSNIDFFGFLKENFIFSWRNLETGVKD